jgi:hypothetical protein
MSLALWGVLHCKHMLFFQNRQGSTTICKCARCALACVHYTRHMRLAEDGKGYILSFFLELSRLTRALFQYPSDRYLSPLHPPLMWRIVLKKDGDRMPWMQFVFEGTTPSCSRPQDTAWWDEVDSTLKEVGMHLFIPFVQLLQHYIGCSFHNSDPKSLFAST